jgi:hypothetical protein
MHPSRFFLPLLFAIGGCASILGTDFDDLNPKGGSTTTEGGRQDGASTSPTDPAASSGITPSPTKPSADTGECPAPTTKKCGDLCVSPADQQFGCNCKPMSRFYEDKDGDGFGSDRVMFACAIGPGLSETSGDCHDGNKDVFPGQAKYFGQSYTSPTTGKKSFDYDCSGDEERDPSIDPYYEDHPICTPSTTCLDGLTVWCWKPVDAVPRKGGFDKCGAQLWKCFNIGHEFEKVDYPEQAKAYPCR